MIAITSSTVHYKSPNGGITRRTLSHFVKRTVVFEIDGVGHKIDIGKNILSLGATEEDIIAYIEAHPDIVVPVDSQLHALQSLVDMLVLENLEGGL